MTWALEIGEVVDVLRGFNDNSFDALACDPPYGFSFMGKKWARLAHWCPECEVA